MNENQNVLIKALKGYKDKKGNKIYYTKYKASLISLKDYYEVVETGAQQVDPKMFLNDHGLDHVEKVLLHASNMVEYGKIDFNIKEIYILVISILFHDVGNFFGRNEHEADTKILKELKEHYCDDHIEYITIKSIIDAHGGADKNGDKDKISKLHDKDKIGEFNIRLQPIAAVLRFADELADDCERASNAMLKHNKICSDSEIYHVYSQSLQVPEICYNSSSIKLDYHVYQKYIHNQISGKFLIDEIYNRIYKMHRERIYCLKFLSPFIHINKICVAIVFVEDEDTDRITFDVFDKGYPDNAESLFDICEGLYDGKIKKDGEYYDNHIGTKKGCSI